MPVLTDRNNVIVMADEAHRTQYGFNAKYDDKGEGIKYGYAKYLRDALPNATFVDLREHQSLQQIKIRKWYSAITLMFMI